MRNRHRRVRSTPTTPDVNAGNRLHHTTFGYAKRSTSVETNDKACESDGLRLSHPDLISPKRDFHPHSRHGREDTPQSRASKGNRSPRMPKSPSHTYSKTEMMEGTIETLQEDLLHLKSKYLHLQAHQRKTEQWAQYMEDRALKAEQICSTMHKVLSDNESEKDRSKKTVLSTHFQAIKRILDKFNVVKGQSKWKKEAFVEEQKIITHRPEEEKASIRFEVRTEKYLFSDMNPRDRKHATSIPITESLYIDYMKELEVNAKVCRNKMLSALTSMALAKKDYASLELERERNSKRGNNKYSTPRSSPHKDAAINVDDIFFNENAYKKIHDTHHHSHKYGSTYTDEDDNYEIEQPDISRVSKLLLKNCTECGCKYIIDKTIREQLRPTKLILKDSGYEYDISDEGDNFMQTQRELTLAKAQVSAFKSHVKHLREENARMQISLQTLKEKLVLDPEIEIWDREHSKNRNISLPRNTQSAYSEEMPLGPVKESKFDDDDDDDGEITRMGMNEAALQKLHSAMLSFSTTA